jgi:hypothetical protein
MQQSAVKKAIFEKIAEIEDLLLVAECEGVQFVSLDCYEDVDMAVGNLLQQIDYYVD